MGFNRKGNMAVERVLSNPIYAGLLKVESYKDYAGGMFPGIHEPIINLLTLKFVQEKMKRPLKIKTVIDDNIPLRGVLKCHCGQPLSGAPSRGKAGRYYYYYKCKHSRHNNISAIKSHEQFLKICDLMSLPIENIKKIKLSCRKSLDSELKENQIVLKENQKKLLEIEQNLYSVEDKWIKNDITKETFERWSDLYNNEIKVLNNSIERLSTNQNKAYKILEKNLKCLSDIRQIYSKASTIEKREFVNLVFDSNLYYENGIYRTPTMLGIFGSISKLGEKKNIDNFVEC